MVDYIKARSRQPGLAAHIRAYLNTAQAPAYPIFNGGTTPTGTRYLHHALTWHVYNSGFVEVVGSLHKAWNSLNGRDATNYNDFKRLDVFDVLHWLTQEMNVELDTATVHRLEIGVNFALPPAPPTVQDLLGRLVYFGSGKPFEEQPVERGYYKRLDSSDFYVKAYSKSGQYELPDQVLRFELGVSEMKHLNKPDHPPLVRNLADLTRPDVLAQLGTPLLQTFDRCVWAEDFTAHDLTLDEREVVRTAQDCAHVACLKPDQRTRLKKRYEQLTARLDYSLKTDLRTRIGDQWAYLLETDAQCFRGGYVQGFRNGGMQSFRRLDKSLKPCIDPNQPLPNKTTPTNPKNAVDQPANTSRRCPVTGLDIDHQPNRTRFVSKSTVKTLFTTDRAAFEALARTYLTTKQAGAALDKQAYHIAHNVRNRHHNPNHNPRNSTLRVVARADARLNAHPTLNGLDLSGTLRLRPDQQQRID